MPETRAICSPEAWDFARVQELWDRLSPLTPYGKDAKEEKAVLADRSELEWVYDRTEDLIALLRSASSALADRITYHLRRLPRLPIARGAEVSGLDIIEIFQVKKFVANYRAIIRLLDPVTRERFGLAFHSEALAARLDEGGSDAETFAIADSYHADLPTLRAEIADREAAIRRARAAAKAELKIERALDFGPRDFLVLPHDEARGLLEPGGRCSSLISVEAYDSRSCIVRMQDGPDVLKLEEERDSFAAREREVEAEVVASLSRAIAEEAASLLDYVDAMRDFDLARARASLAMSLGCVRPDFGSATLEVDDGRFIPCEDDCARLGLAYSRVRFSLEERAGILFGSNMGGKTVALQSLLFFQIAAQSGLFVPAGRFATSVYAHLRYVGESRGFASNTSRLARCAIDTGGDDATCWRGGLSGFGFDIRAFVEAWDAAREDGAFLVFDEFARTTSSAEAEAIVSASVEALAALSGVRSLFSTHFRGVARLPGIRYLRMRGLDRCAAGEVMAADEPVARRIRRINSMMRYEIVDADGAGEGSDAIAIASLLGLDAGIAARAAELYADRDDAECQGG
jgi:DNA mismatch repair protein MutS2